MTRTASATRRVMDLCLQHWIISFFFLGLQYSSTRGKYALGLKHCEETVKYSDIKILKNSRYKLDGNQTLKQLDTKFYLQVVFLKWLTVSLTF